MVEIPETRYARNGPVNLAYQVVGDGPIDLMYLSPGITHLDYRWQYPPYAHIFDRFAAYSREVLYDKRGCGLSDRTVEPPTIAEDVSDAVAILDELGIEQAYLFGIGEGGSAALALAAAHPDRVTKIALYGAFCRVRASEDFPWGTDPVVFDAMLSTMESTWGGTTFLETLAPNHAHDPALARWYAGMNRAGVSPAGAAAWMRNLSELDIRPVLGEVAAPVLVTNRADTEIPDPPARVAT